jgi:hypothetical protein
MASEIVLGESSSLVNQLGSVKTAQMHCDCSFLKTQQQNSHSNLLVAFQQSQHIPVPPPSKTLCKLVLCSSHTPTRFSCHFLLS